MKAYNHLLDYLHRWTICKIGKLHIRIHHILSSDGTPFLHSHPFWYVSIIFKGGYTEHVLVGDKLKEVQHVAPTFIVRSPFTYHRICDIKGTCKTLFFTWRSASPWNIVTHPDIPIPNTYRVPHQPGVYRRTTNGRPVCSKFDGGVWFVGKLLPEDAAECDKLSVHQSTPWEEL